MKLSIGKLRGMQQISTSTGKIAVLALDQRGSITQNLGIFKGSPDLYEKLRDFKLQVVKALAGHASAVLLDPEYGAPQAVAGGVLPGSRGLIVTLEETGYVNTPEARLNRVIPNWSLAKAKKMGASAVKLLVYYNPFSGKSADDQESLVERLVEEARAEDIPLLVEPVSYSASAGLLKESIEFAARRPEIVIETARRLGSLGIDMLKMEFPYDATFDQDEANWERSCTEITMSSPVPWVLLSAGVDFDIFKRQLMVACKAGASGFVAGRSIWKEATMLRHEQRDAFLETIAANRLIELCALAEKYANPWINFYSNQADMVNKDWYQTYPG